MVTMSASVRRRLVQTFTLATAIVLVRKRVPAAITRLRLRAPKIVTALTIITWERPQCRSGRGLTLIGFNSHLRNGCTAGRNTARVRPLLPATASLLAHHPSNAMTTSAASLAKVPHHRPAATLRVRRWTNSAGSSSAFEVFTSGSVQVLFFLDPIPPK